MKFCPNCNNNCIITRLTAAQESKLFAQDSNNDGELANDKNKNDQNEKNIKNDTNDQSSQSKAYFKCTNCDYLEAIIEGTLILSRTQNTSSTEYSGIYKQNEMINDNTLPHTRNYICPNKSCVSNTDHEKRDAVWFKPSQNTYNIKMICIACKAMW